MHRKTFFKIAAGASLSVIARPLQNLWGALVPVASPGNYPPPRWRGFNLCEMFVTADDPRWPDMTVSPRGRFDENHFRWISDWGFNFVRLPLSYRWWSSPEAPDNIRESAFEPVDRAVEWAQRYRLHLSLNLHHAPGFCINQGSRDAFMPAEPFDLWKDPAALECFIRHWQFIARRYAGVSSDWLSFNYVNEPRCPREAYDRVIRATTSAIREITPDRLLVADGLNVGKDPCPEFSDLKLVQSCRGYAPVEVSHYQAWWSRSKPSIPPAWPMRAADGEYWDRARLERHYAAWFALKDSGVPVFCGECGAWNHTPHAVFLAWLGDLLDVLGEHGIGWALWNFRGSMGLLDAGRPDAHTVDWHGCQLDTQLLALLQRH